METKINLLYRGGGSSGVRRRKFEAKSRGYEPQLNQKKISMKRKSFDCLKYWKNKD